MGPLEEQIKNSVGNNTFTQFITTKIENNNINELQETLNKIDELKEKKEININVNSNIGEAINLLKEYISIKKEAIEIEQKANDVERIGNEIRSNGTATSLSYYQDLEDKAKSAYKAISDLNNIKDIKSLPNSIENAIDKIDELRKHTSELGLTQQDLIEKYGTLGELIVSISNEKLHDSLIDASINLSKSLDDNLDKLRSLSDVLQVAYDHEKNFSKSLNDTNYNLNDNVKSINDYKSRIDSLGNSNISLEIRTNLNDISTKVGNTRDEISELISEVNNGINNNNNIEGFINNFLNPDSINNKIESISGHLGEIVGKIPKQITQMIENQTVSFDNAQGMFDFTKYSSQFYGITSDIMINFQEAMQKMIQNQISELNDNIANELSNNENADVSGLEQQKQQYESILSKINESVNEELKKISTDKAILFGNKISNLELAYQTDLSYFDFEGMFKKNFDSQFDNSKAILEKTSGMKNLMDSNTYSGGKNTQKILDTYGINLDEISKNAQRNASISRQISMDLPSMLQELTNASKNNDIDQIQATLPELNNIIDRVLSFDIESYKNIFNANSDAAKNDKFIQDLQNITGRQISNITQLIQSILLATDMIESAGVDLDENGEKLSQLKDKLGELKNYEEGKSSTPSESDISSKLEKFLSTIDKWASNLPIIGATYGIMKSPYDAYNKIGINNMSPDSSWNESVNYAKTFESMTYNTSRISQVYDLNLQDSDINYLTDERAKELFEISNGKIGIDQLSNNFNSIVSGVGVRNTNDAMQLTEYSTLLQNVSDLSGSDINSLMSTLYRDIGLSAESTIVSMDKVISRAKLANVPIAEYAKTIQSLAEGYRRVGLDGEDAINVMNNLIDTGMSYQDAKAVAEQLPNSITKFSDNTGQVILSGLLQGESDPFKMLFESQHVTAPGWGTTMANSMQTMLNMNRSLFGDSYLGDYRILQVLRNDFGFTQKSASDIFDKLQQGEITNLAELLEDEDSPYKTSDSIQEDMLDQVKSIAENVGTIAGMQSKVDLNAMNNSTMVENLAGTLNSTDENGESYLSKNIESINTQLGQQTNLLIGYLKSPLGELVQGNAYIVTMLTAIVGLLGGITFLGKTGGKLGKELLENGADDVIKKTAGNLTNDATKVAKNATNVADDAAKVVVQTSSGKINSTARNMTNYTEDLVKSFKLDKYNVIDDGTVRLGNKPIGNVNAIGKNSGMVKEFGDNAEFIANHFKNGGKNATNSAKVINTATDVAEVAATSIDDIGEAVVVGKNASIISKGLSKAGNVAKTSLNYGKNAAKSGITKGGLLLDVAFEGFEAYNEYNNDIAALQEQGGLIAGDRMIAGSENAINFATETAGGALGGWGGAAAGAAVGAAIGSVVPIIGTALGGAIGGIIGGVGGSILGDKAGEYIGDQINNAAFADDKATNDALREITYGDGLQSILAESYMNAGANETTANLMAQGINEFKDELRELDNNDGTMEAFAAYYAEQKSQGKTNEQIMKEFKENQTTIVPDMMSQLEANGIRINNIDALGKEGTTTGEVLDTYEGVTANNDAIIELLFTSTVGGENLAEIAKDNSFDSSEIYAGLSDSVRTTVRSYLNEDGSLDWDSFKKYSETDEKTKAAYDELTNLSNTNGKLTDDENIKRLQENSKETYENMSSGFSNRGDEEYKQTYMDFFSNWGTTGEMTYHTAQGNVNLKLKELLGDMAIIGEISDDPSDIYRSMILGEGDISDADMQAILKRIEENVVLTEEQKAQLEETKNYSANKQAEQEAQERLRTSNYNVAEELINNTDYMKELSTVLGDSETAIDILNDTVNELSNNGIEINNVDEISAVIKGSLVYQANDTEEEREFNKIATDNTYSGILSKYNIQESSIFNKGAIKESVKLGSRSDSTNVIFGNENYKNNIKDLIIETINGKPNDVGKAFLQEQFGLDENTDYTSYFNDTTMKTLLNDYLNSTEFDLDIRNLAPKGSELSHTVMNEKVYDTLLTLQAGQGVSLNNLYIDDDKHTEEQQGLTNVRAFYTGNKEEDGSLQMKFLTTYADGSTEEWSGNTRNLTALLDAYANDDTVMNIFEAVQNVGNLIQEGNDQDAEYYGKSNQGYLGAGQLILANDSIYNSSYLTGQSSSTTDWESIRNTIDSAPGNISYLGGDSQGLSVGMSQLTNVYSDTIPTLQSEATRSAYNANLNVNMYGVPRAMAEEAANASAETWRRSGAQLVVDYQASPY